MRPRYVINKGIQKNITAIGRVFVPTLIYTAAIYNPKDTSKKIIATGVCAVEKERNVVRFVFTSEQTALLKEGCVHIEIYDQYDYKMVYRENFAVVRKNSLPITPIPQDMPDEILMYEEWGEDRPMTTDGDTEGVSFMLKTGRPVKFHISVEYKEIVDPITGDIIQPDYHLEGVWTLYPSHKETLTDSIATTVYNNASHGSYTQTPVFLMEAWVMPLETGVENEHVEVDIFVPESES